MPLDGFFRIQILPNSISAGALSRSPLGRLTTLPQTAYSRLGRGTPPPHFSPPRRLRRLAHRASPLFKTFRRPWRTRSVHVARPASHRLEFANFARTFPLELIHVFRTQWPVCCWAPYRQEISIDSGGRRAPSGSGAAARRATANCAQQQMRAVSRCQLT